MTLLAVWASCLLLLKHKTGLVGAWLRQTLPSAAWPAAQSPLEVTAFGEPLPSRAPA